MKNENSTHITGNVQNRLPKMSQDIENIFKLFKNHNYFIYKAKIKLIKLKKYNLDKTLDIYLKTQWKGTINSMTTTNEKNLFKLSVRFVTTTKKTIRYLIATMQNNNNLKTEVGIYKIDCKN